MLPVYNAGKTLGRALDSLFRQTYRPLEIITVDDGSYDGSDRMLQGAARTAPDGVVVRIITHERNMGSGAARRAAVKVAAGEYMAALDADDTLAPDAIYNMVEAAEKGRADMVCCEYEEIRPGGRRLVHRFDVDESLRLNEMKMDTLRFALWNKLIRTSLYRRALRFERGVDCWEDLEQIAAILLLEPKIQILRQPLYQYTVNPRSGSLTHSGADRILRQHLLVARRMEQYFSSKGMEQVYAPFLTYLKFIAKVKYLRNSEALVHPLRSLRQWRDEFPEVNSRIRTLPHVPLRHRLAFMAANALSRLLPT